MRFRFALALVLTLLAASASVLSPVRVGCQPFSHKFHVGPCTIEATLRGDHASLAVEGWQPGMRSEMWVKWR